MPASEFGLNPTNVPASRIMAVPADLSHSPAGLDWQRRIVETEPAILEPATVRLFPKKFRGTNFFLVHLLSAGGHDLFTKRKTN